MTDIKTFPDPAEVLDYFRLSHTRWAVAHVMSIEHTWLFRGQGDSRWTLQPKSLRIHPPPPSSSTTQISLPWSQLARELEQLRAFVSLSQELGIICPSLGDTRDYYKSIVDRAEGTSDELPHMSENLLELSALAQHHGVSTRLLDWTASPLAALYFGAADAYNATDDRESFAVWAAPRMGGHFETRVKLMKPNWSGNQYARSQLGYLTVDTMVDEDYDPVTGWPSQDAPLTEYFKKHAGGAALMRSNTNLRKIEIPRSAAAEILCLLYREGISLAHLMPTADNVVHTNRMMSSLSDVWRTRLRSSLSTTKSDL